ncbi:DUF2339 domain-containing protein [Adhaeribacter sp. BT258]|uniref:DUF2339 domain-containing protein n=2 Tax=Adhaeribacter terrigena TaxID=2793070 RepID=A0ABS1C390_9BACT|nr:DUF2339 domain-containing protein [Adhaeribacter terrigena]
MMLLLAIVVAAFLIINILSGRIQEVSLRFETIKDELLRIRAELELLRRQQTPPSLQKTATPEEIKPVTVTSPAAPILTPPEVTEIPKPAFPFATAPAKTVSATEEKPGEKLAEKTEGNAAETVGKTTEKVEETPAAEKPVYTPPIAPEPVYEEPQPGFMERFMHNNPDLEKFIGENLINKIGIAILVLGIGYFVKFAIDQDWINEIGRVFIGILAGGVLIGLAHRLRKSFSAFSSVLVGGGLAVLYFTIAIAFHEYQLLNQTAAFLVMVVITAFSVLLSVSYNRVELAVLAILGGFATPFMVSTGEGNYVVLFTYILILNVGMLVLAYLKNWKIINWICYGATILLYGGWLSSRVLGQPNAPYLGALTFAVLFYTVFFLMNIINNVKARTHFVASEIGILVSNTFLFYSAGMAILHEFQQGMYQGLFTAAVAVFNFAFAFLLFRNRQVDRNLVYLLIGMVITFISLSIPVQLEGNYITMFWALEAVLLLWFAQKTGIKLAVISSVIITGLMLISLAMDWVNIYQRFPAGETYYVLLNKGFITGAISILSLVALRWLLQKEPEPVVFKQFDFQPLVYRKLLGFAAVITLYLVLLFELNYQLNFYFDSNLSRTIMLGCYNLGFIAGLFGLAEHKNEPKLTLTITLLGMFGVALYCLFYNIQVRKLLESHFLYDVQEFTGFWFHYLSLALLVVLLYFIYRNRFVLEEHWPKMTKVLVWGLSLVIVFVASSELLYHVLYFNLPFANASGLKGDQFAADKFAYFYELQHQTYKVGFPILWGICAFTFMFIGLKKKNKQLRIVALSLFAITLLKLFLFDIRGISEGGKIAAFICLGVLLLIISFMYQNLKKLILADEAGNQKDGTP